MRTRIVASDGFEEGISYRVVPCAAPPPEAETDTEERALELMILWGDSSVLAVEHLAPGRAFSVGDARDERGKLRTDFLIGADDLGSEQLPIVIERDGGSAVLVPAGASYVLGDGVPERSERAQQVVLTRGQSMRIDHGAFSFIVREVAGGKRIGVGGTPQLELKRHSWTLASFGSHAFLILLMYFLPPSSSALSMDALREDARYSRYLTIPVSVEPDEPVLTPLNEDKPAEVGKAEKGDVGQIGKKTAPSTKNRYAIKHVNDEPEAMARETAKSLAASAGIIGILRQEVGAFDSPTSVYGAATANGSDAISAIGALFGKLPGESFGFNGLGSIGTGRHGGGDGEGTIGVGTIGTIGHDGKYGSHTGGLGGRHGVVPPRIRSLPPEIMGSLSKEVIRREIGRHIAEVRFCYSQALNANPDLQGRVAVKFIISPTGAVTQSVVASSDLGNSATEQCIAKVVSRINFPQPQGGIVVVTYPFVLQQTGN